MWLRRTVCQLGVGVRIGARFASSKASMPLREQPRVIYRGGPYMRKGWFYLAGTCFVLAGVNFGLFIRDFLVWPLFPDEGEEPELVTPMIRYTAAGGTFLVASLCGMYFWYAPSRMVTRLTVYPKTQMLGVRTAAPPPSRWLPASIAVRPYFQRAGPLSETDQKERLVPLEAVYRLQGSAVGSEMHEWNELVKKKKDRVPASVLSKLQKYNATATKYDQQETLMLRIADARLAFQLGASPYRTTLLQQPPERGIKAFWRQTMRGRTDWSPPTASYQPTPAEDAAQKQRTAHVDTEPWFLDRANFDQLFPLDASRYKKKTSA